MIETTGWPLAALLVGLTMFAVVMAATYHLGVSRQLGYAAVRAAVQLAAVSAILVAVLESGWLTAAFIAFMLLVGAWTSWRRIGGTGPPMWTAAPIALGVAPVLAAVLVSGVIPLVPQAVLPIAGIIIGNAMTATSVVGRLSLEQLRGRRGEYEAGLAIGLTDRDAALLLIRPQATTALVPTMDQTRTVGLVTLPGAFIGVLLGGGSAAQAGAAQLLVLIAILAAQVVAVAIMIEALARTSGNIKA